MTAPNLRPLSTRILLLIELHHRAHAKLKPLADRLGVTQQAVSVVLRRLVKEGLVANRDGVWKPTQTGTDGVHESMKDLRRFVDEAARSLRVIDETFAQADAPVAPGQSLGLYMRDGRLRAAPRVYAGSQGRAKENARPGDLVRIGELRGIVSLSPATLTVVAHPPRLTPVQFRRAKRLVAQHRRTAATRLGAHDLSSAVILERLGRAAHFEFAPLASALDAVRRGVPVQYWVPVGDLPDCLVQVAQANGSGPQPLKVQSVEL